jgi:hypothetical protein
MIGATKAYGDSRRTDTDNVYQSIRATQDQDEIITIDRRNIHDVQEIYSDEEQKETDNLYEEVDETHHKDKDYNQNLVQSSMRGTHADPQYYHDVLNGPTYEQQNLRKPSANEFRICYSKPKFPRRNLTTERLAEPKKQPIVTNPFMYSDFRGMIHADYQEAIENMDVQPTYAGKTDNRLFGGLSDASQTGMSNLRSRKKYSESVKEMFPMPEFNTYLSQPTKIKDRRKLNKPYTAAIGFRTHNNLKPQVSNSIFI